jgi:exosortase
MSVVAEAVSTRPETPESQALVPPAVWVGLAALLCCILVMYWRTLTWLVSVWESSPDYSHGYLVPVFAAYLVWTRRGLAPSVDRTPSYSSLAVGVALIAAGTALLSFGIYSRSRFLEACSIVVTLSGVALLSFGFAGARWLLPAVGFLIFMVPPPKSIAHLLSANLQSIATSASTFILQTVGVPAVATGNVIELSQTSLGVAEACSGLRMLISFAAIAFAGALLSSRPLWERIVACISSPIIAIAVNVIRIVVTALAYEFGNPKMAEFVFHDAAGWLMMPVGVLFLVLEMWFLSRIWIDPDEQR